MMEAVRTSEKSVDNYFTRQYIPEDNSELHTCHRENLKSHIEPHYPYLGVTGLIPPENILRKRPGFTLEEGIEAMSE
jgi:hypothetical protein